jgi:uncharacterized oligopeptide transporter (OPT) family protein
MARYREVTISSIVFGVVVGALMNASITYAGLKIGFTIGGSAIAAVLGFGVLRGVLGRMIRGGGSILETNIGQTIASAVNIPNSGIIFTVPVLYLLGYDLSPYRPDFWLITLACMAGSVLGAAFIIPLRKQMIDIDRLRFPTGTAVAAILKSPGAGGRKSLVLLAGAVIAAIVYAPTMLPSFKYQPSLDELPDLILSEKITPKQADKTRLVAEWKEAGAVPQDVLNRGKSQQELIEQKRLDPQQADALAIDAYKTLVEQEKPLDDFVNRHWARAPRFWGYSDVDWRLPLPPPPKEGDVEAEARHRLAMRDVDHDGNGRPDLIMSDDHIDAGRAIGLPPYIQFVFAIAPFALGAGYITGRPGLLVLAGGVLAYFVLNPLMYSMGLMPASIAPHEAANIGRDAFNRSLGIGMLLGGALMGVVFALPALLAAVKSISSAARTAGGSTELGFRVIGVAAVLCFIGLYLAADFIRGKPAPAKQKESARDTAEETPDQNEKDAPAGDEPSAGDAATQADGRPPDQNDAGSKAAESPAAEQAEDPPASGGLLSGLNHHVASLIIALVGGIWIWFAGIIIAQCTGMTDWSPISGMALITVVLIMALGGSADVMGAVLIGAALCVAVTCAADMMQDLKTGHLVGAIPKRQQIVELVATGIGPLLSMLTLLLIVSVNVRVSGEPIGDQTPTSAPQAQALQKVVEGVQGDELPYTLYGAGALMGVGLGLGSFPGLGVLVGLSMYLPIAYILTYGIGCLANMFVARVKGGEWAEEWGVPFCAGLIVGEGVLALILNFALMLTS